jgi:hypothetical protein
MSERCSCVAIPSYDLGELLIAALQAGLDGKAASTLEYIGRNAHRAPQALGRLIGAIQDSGPDPNGDEWQKQLFELHETLMEILETR